MLEVRPNGCTYHGNPSDCEYCQAADCVYEFAPSKTKNDKKLEWARQNAEKRKESIRKYSHSEKRKACNRRYKASEKGRAKNKIYQQKYHENHAEQEKAYKKEYNQRPDIKAKRQEYNKRYREEVKNDPVAFKARQEYMKAYKQAYKERRRELYRMKSAKEKHADHLAQNRIYYKLEKHQTQTDYMKFAKETKPYEFNGIKRMRKVSEDGNSEE